MRNPMSTARSPVDPATSTSSPAATLRPTRALASPRAWAPAEPRFPWTIAPEPLACRLRRRHCRIRLGDRAVVAGAVDPDADVEVRGIDPAGRAACRALGPLQLLSDTAAVSPASRLGRAGSEATSDTAATTSSTIASTSTASPASISPATGAGGAGMSPSAHADGANAAAPSATTRVAVSPVLPARAARLPLPASITYMADFSVSYSRISAIYSSAVLLSMSIAMRRSTAASWIRTGSRNRSVTFR